MKYDFVIYSTTARNLVEVEEYDTYEAAVAAATRMKLLADKNKRPMYIVREDAPGDRKILINFLTSMSELSEDSFAISYAWHNAKTIRRGT